MPRIAVLLLCLAAVFPVSAQTTGKLTGRITDTAGEPLIGVNVRIDGTQRGAITDTDGNYFIIGVPVGTYTIVASYIGFTTQRVENVRVSVDRTTEVDFQLREEALGLDEVTVTAQRSLVTLDQTSASAKVSGDQLLDLPANSFQEVVALQAGVTRGADGSLHIRGGRSSEIKYYVDGVAVSNPYNNGLVAPVENSAVEEVEVISGTYNAEYGQANSGIVNIVTRSGSDTFEGSIVTSVGGYFSSRDDVFRDISEASATGERYLEASLAGPLGLRGLNFFANTKVSSLDGWLYGRRAFLPTDSSSFRANNGGDWLVTANGDSAVVPMNSTKAMTNLGKLTFQATSNVRLQYSLTRYSAESKTYSHLFRLNPDARPTLFTTNYNHLVSLNHLLNARTFYDLRLTAYLTDFRQSVFEDPLDPGYTALYRPASQEPAFVFNTGGLDAYWTNRRSYTYAARLDVTRQFGSTHLVKVGGEYRYNLLRYSEFSLEVNPVQYGDRLPHIPDASSTRNNSYRRTPVEVAAFIQDKIEINDLIVNAGLRFDYFDSNGLVPNNLSDPQNVLRGEGYREATVKTQFSPRFGFAFPITAEGVVHASYGHFFQIPEYGRLFENPDFEVQGSNLTAFIGNADLEPQRSTQYEIGLQQQVGGNFVVDVTAYYRDLRNLIGTAFYQTAAGSDVYGRYENVDFGNVRGLTVSLGYRFPSMQGSVNYTYQSARGNGSDPKQAFFDRQSGTAAQRILIPLDWDQRHNVGADLALDVQGFSVGFIGTFLSGYPFTPRDINRQPVTELRNLARYGSELRLDARVSRSVRLAGVTARLFMQGENLLDSWRPDRLPQLPQREIDVWETSGRDRINTLEEFLTNPAIQPRPRQVRLGFEARF